MYAKSHSSLYQVTLVSLKDKHQDADKIMSQLNKDLNLAKNQKLYSFGLLANKTDGLLSIVACAFLAILIVLADILLSIILCNCLSIMIFIFMDNLKQ